MFTITCYRKTWYCLDHWVQISPILTLSLPWRDPGEEKVRSPRFQHPIWVYNRWSPYLHFPAENVLRWIPRYSFQGKSFFVFNHIKFLIVFRKFFIHQIDSRWFKYLNKDLNIGLNTFMTYLFTTKLLIINSFHFLAVSYIHGRSYKLRWSCNWWLGQTLYDEHISWLLQLRSVTYRSHLLRKWNLQTNWHRMW